MKIKTFDNPLDETKKGKNELRDLVKKGIVWIRDKAVLANEWGKDNKDIVACMGIFVTGFEMANILNNRRIEKMKNEYIEKLTTIILKLYIESVVKKD